MGGDGEGGSEREREGLRGRRREGGGKERKERERRRGRGRRRETLHYCRGHWSRCGGCGAGFGDHRQAGAPQACAQAEASLPPPRKSVSTLLRSSLTESGPLKIILPVKVRWLGMTMDTGSVLSQQSRSGAFLRDG